MKLASTILVLCLILAFAPVAYADEDGGAVYKAKCALCHGPDGDGNTAMGKKLGLKALSSAEVQKLTDDQIRQTIVKGKGKMPSFDKKVTGDQQKALVAHIRSLGKK